MTKPKFAPTARPCAQCREPFTPEYETGQYCSQACRQKAYRQRQGATEKRGRPRKPRASQLPIPAEAYTPTRRP